MDLAQAIKRKRPNLSKRSIKSYVIILQKLAQRLGLTEIKNFDYLTNLRKVIKVLPANKNTRKNYIAGIVVALDTQGDKYEDALNNWRAYMDMLIEENNHTEEKQEKNDKQKTNWVAYQKLNKLAQYKFNQVKRYIKKKGELTNKDLQEIQEALILNLYLFRETPPRRLEYANCVIINKKNYEELTLKQQQKTNWLVIPPRKGKKYFIFNKYKTAKTYGMQVLMCNRNVSYLINLLLKHNPDRKWLLMNKNNETKMTKNTLTKITLKIMKKEFNKNISISMIRHIYISEVVLKDMPKLNELSRIAEEMGHNIHTQALYRKT